MKVKPQSVKGAILLIVVIVAFVTVITYSGISHTRSALQIGYIGTNGWSSWSGHYELLDGKIRKTLHFDSSQNIALKVKTESGALSVEIKDKTGNIIFSQSGVGNISRTISVDGNIVVTLSAEKHKGSFSIN